MPVDPRVALVRLLVDAVVVGRMGMRGGGQATRDRIGVLGGVDRDRTGVHDGRHPIGAASGGLEDVDRADDVDECSPRRVGTAEGDLERRQMDEVRDLVPVDGAFDGAQVGDVADLEADSRKLVGGHDETEPAGIAPEIERDHLRTVAHEGADRPGPDAPEGAGDEEALRQRSAIPWDRHDDQLLDVR